MSFLRHLFIFALTFAFYVIRFLYLSAINFSFFARVLVIETSLKLIHSTQGHIIGHVNMYLVKINPEKY